MKNLMLIVPLLVSALPAEAAKIKPVAGRYKCTGYATLTVSTPFTDEASSPMKSVSGTLTANKNGSFTLAVRDTEYSTYLEGRIPTPPSLIFTADMGRWDLYNSNTLTYPTALWYTNRNYTQNTCGCTFLPETFETTAQGTQNRNGRKLSINVRQVFIKKYSYINRQNYWGLNCKR